MNTPTLRAIACCLSLLCFAPFPSMGQPKENKGHLARAMYAAFYCSVYANLSKQAEEQERLFRIGHSAGIKFLEAWRKGEITKEEFSNSVPMGVLFMLAGPTNEFIVGRIFEGASREAFNNVVYGSEWGNGTAQDGGNEHQRRLLAMNAYTAANCSIIR